MSAQEYHDSNFLIVAAVEEYAFRHHMKTEDVIYKFKRHNIFSAIRSQYKVFILQQYNHKLNHGLRI